MLKSFPYTKEDKNLIHQTTCLSQSRLPHLKSLKKHVNKHLINYLNKCKLILERQSGFLQKHSWKIAFMKLIDQWMQCMNNGDFEGCSFVDFKKAFDVVNHSILFKKLINYRFNRKSMAWFTSYLSDRQQTVVHGKGLSAFTYMKSGVPQVSILGPTLFLLFINDLPLFMNYCYSDFFADDATLHTHDSIPDKVE